jgi:hypothetical protein
MEGEQLMSINLTDEVRQWIECEKIVEGERIRFDAPKPAKRLDIPLFSEQVPSDKFVLSLYEGARSSALILSLDAPRKFTMQARHASLPLVRIDIDERAKHTNPDGKVLCGSHVHVAVEGYGCSFAFPLSSDEGIMIAGSSEDVPEVFESFRRYCHIDDNLTIKWSLGI